MILEILSPSWPLTRALRKVRQQAARPGMLRPRFSVEASELDGPSNGQPFAHDVACIRSAHDRPWAFGNSGLEMFALIITTFIYVDSSLATSEVENVVTATVSGFESQVLCEKAIAIVTGEYRNLQRTAVCVQMK